MKKNLFLAALAFIALVSCTSDEFVGDNTSPNTSNTAGAIQFTSNAPRITRGTSDDASTLGYKFKVYATKTVTENSTDATSNVFAREEYSTDDNYSATPYDVWYAENTANGTSSNTSGWDYVGTNGNSYGTVVGSDNYKVELTADQTIKYWDYGAKQYDFVAYSATVETGTGDEKRPKITNYTTNGFTVEATAAQLAGLYVADKVTLKSSVADNVDNNPTKPATSINKIGGIVQFTFRSSATKVRLGIYETIPGYVVQNVNFRPNASEFTATTANAKLSGSFNGSSSAENATYTVTYNSDGLAVFSASADASTHFDFGTFASATPTAIGETSTSPMWASGSSDYQSVLPNTDATKIGNMILYVDYDLYNSVSGETIHVKGAKAVVPSIYMKWNPNYAYTYLFKISDNTNGTTGTEGGLNPSPQGLYPITFDALTIAGTNDEVGTITTVSTPAITTYQQGSVVDKDATQTVASQHGITYANANGPIYITVNTNGTLADLTVDNMRLYTVDDGTTEADLLLTNKTKNAVTGNNALSILDTNTTLQGIAFTSDKAAYFTPAASTTYAVEYLDITEVTGLTVGTSSVTGLYEKTGTSTPFTYTKITDSTAKAESAKIYCTVVPQYKIIEVGANPSTTR